jgi:hypothetical protein
MQTEKKVFEKLFASDKVELESQKIELGIVDDAKKGIDMVSKAFSNGVWNELERLPNQVLQIVAQASSVLKEASKGQGIAIENARKASAMAKELGVPNPKEIDAIFSNSDYDVLLEAFNKDVDKIIANAKKY